MRSLEEWTRYLEEQEKELKQAQVREPEPPAPAREPEKPVVVEEHRPVQAAPTPPPAPPVTPAPPSAPVMPTAAVTTEPPAQVQKPVDKVKKQTPQPAPKQEVVQPRDEPADLGPVTRMRKRLPETMSTIPDGGHEVAQSSYVSFRETREELLQRLLDPQLSLEDTARILNVCPTTVRRYTNRGLLKHYRTAGNQRRFRLSDVLAFLESQASDGRISD